MTVNNTKKSKKDYDLFIEEILLHMLLIKQCQRIKPLLLHAHKLKGIDNPSNLSARTILRQIQFTS